MGKRQGERALWARRLGLVAPRSKYGAKRTIVDGIWFDSGKEARRYGELKLLENAGKISNLETQPAFPIDVVALWRPRQTRIIRCGFFTADFRYVDLATGEVVIEDTKSLPTKTTAYRLRKRLVEAIHGVTVNEV
jgi:Protein of unknown function (DUF1064)